MYICPSVILFVSCIYIYIYIFIYHINIEIYSLHFHIVNFRTFIVLSQSQSAYQHFTCKKNDTLNQKPRIAFFMCEKNDTSNQKRER